MDSTYIFNPEKSEMHCGTCGKETDTCYTDEGTLGLVHGFCQCRDCYAKTHPPCPECNDLTDPMWKFCAHCGKKL